MQPTARCACPAALQPLRRALPARHVAMAHMPTPGAHPLQSLHHWDFRSKAGVLLSASNYLSACHVLYLHVLPLCTPCGNGAYAYSRGSTHCNHCIIGTFAPKQVCSSTQNSCKQVLISTPCVGCARPSFAQPCMHTLWQCVLCLALRIYIQQSLHHWDACFPASESHHPSTSTLAAVPMLHSPADHLLVG